MSLFWDIVKPFGFCQPWTVVVGPFWIFVSHFLPWLIIAPFGFWSVVACRPFLEFGSPLLALSVVLGSSRPCTQQAPMLPPTAITSHLPVSVSFGNIYHQLSPPASATTYGLCWGLCPEFQWWLSMFVMIKTAMDRSWPILDFCFPFLALTHYCPFWIWSVVGPFLSLVAHCQPFQLCLALGVHVFNKQQSCHLQLSLATCQSLCPLATSTINRHHQPQPPPLARVGGYAPNSSDC